MKTGRGDPGTRKPVTQGPRNRDDPRESAKETALDHPNSARARSEEGVAVLR